MALADDLGYGTNGLRRWDLANDLGEMDTGMTKLLNKLSLPISLSLPLPLSSLPPLSLALSPSLSLPLSLAPSVSLSLLLSDPRSCLNAAQWMQP